jgi:aspartate racemase
MKSERQPEILGIVGGMGPLASAEFVKTIYEDNLCGREQDAPHVLLSSDPTFPDRTDSFLAGESQLLLERLTAALEYLSQGGASRFVICCMTIHYLLPGVPLALRTRVLSLLDVIFAALARQQQQRHLLICSNGTRRLELFQSHSQWERCAPYIVLPDETDQDRIHRELIYPIKKNPDLRQSMPLLETLLKRYEVDSFIAGCSEIHLLAKHCLANGDSERAYASVDPLAIIAREWGARSVRV